MNPNAPEFQPPSLNSQNDKSRSVKMAKSQDIKSSQQKPASLNNLKNAWSNPIKSVLIAKCPKQNQETEANSSIKSDKRDQRVMSQPLHSEKIIEESNAGWATVGKKGKASDNGAIEAAAPQESEEDLEVKRQLRRERRKREKEAKKIKKDQEKVKAIRADKDTKVKVVDANLLRRAKGKEETFSTGAKPATGKLSFFDEEYPTLASNKKFAAVPKREYSIKSTSTDVSFNSSDTGSEWETEDESDEKVKEILKTSLFEEVEQKKIEVVQSSEPKSFSSILKRPIKNPVIEELSDLISCPPKVLPTTSSASQDVKKVKKKDPITFDIFAALKKKPKVQKSTTVLGSKLKSSSSSSSTVLRNALDSSAPTKRRGKEREKPKKKKPTTMKKLIMSERESRRTERQGNLVLSSRNPDDGSKENQTPEKETSTEETTEKAVATESSSIGEQHPIVEEEKSNPKTVEIPEQTPLEKAKLLFHSRKFRK